MKYTLADIIEKEISFKPMTREQFNSLFDFIEVKIKFLNRCVNWKETYYYRLYADGQLGGLEESYLSAGDNMKSKIEILYDDFDFENFSQIKIDLI